MSIIDGRSIAAKRHIELRSKVEGLKTKPKLVAILVGDDPGSEMYVKMKAKRAGEVGILSEVIRLDKLTELTQLIKLIEKLNEDKTVTGILVQLPLPPGLDTDRVLQTIDPAKDVDGLTGKGKFLPATVKGILTILEEFSPKDKVVTVLGQGRLVGKPLSEELEKMGAKVNRCDEFTDLEVVRMLARAADILISATGMPGLVTANMIKPGAVVIDCGAPSPEVDFEEVSKIASAITPVPGGVGPMTVVSLLENVYSSVIS